MTMTFTNSLWQWSSLFTIILMSTMISIVVIMMMTVSTPHHPTNDDRLLAASSQLVAKPSPPSAANPLQCNSWTVNKAAEESFIIIIIITRHQKIKRKRLKTTKKILLRGCQFHNPNINNILQKLPSVSIFFPEKHPFSRPQIQKHEKNFWVS